MFSIVSVRCTLCKCLLSNSLVYFFCHGYKGQYQFVKSYYTYNAQIALNQTTIAWYECAREQFSVIICPDYKIKTNIESISFTTHIALNQDKFLSCIF